MKDSTKKPSPSELLNELEKNPDLKRQVISEKRLDPKLAFLRAWQSQRLSRTYADLLQSPQYGQASLFFLEDIYGPKDFSQRDHDVERIYSYLSHILPDSSIQLLKDAIDLNRLSHDLDRQLLEVLNDRLGVKGEIKPEDYAEAYRICNNYDLRKLQIQGISQVLLQVSLGARLKVVGLALKIAQKPAIKAGWGELHDFLDRGYSAFRLMKEPKFFVQTIEQRETKILNKIYASDPDPFII